MQIEHRFRVRWRRRFVPGCVCVIKTPPAALRYPIRAKFSFATFCFCQVLRPFFKSPRLANPKSGERESWPLPNRQSRTGDLSQ